MSTRSYISMELENGKYRTIYCHSDGYLTHNGAMLIDHYQDRKKLEELLSLGDISCLCSKVNPDKNFEHSFDFDKRQEDVVVAYHRDRGEEKREARDYSFEKFVNGDWIEYFYVFSLNDEWLYTEGPDMPLQKVQDGLDKEYKHLKIKRPKDFYGFWTEEALKQERKRQNDSAMD